MRYSSLMAFALYIQTESSDEYMFAFDGEPKREEIIKRVKKEMGDEYNYISCYKYDSTYNAKFSIKMR